MELNYETIRNLERRVEMMEVLLEQMMKQNEEPAPVKRRTK